MAVFLLLFFRWLIPVFAIVGCSSSSSFSSATEAPISRIAFGSCSNQSAPQLMWNAINNYNPQLFIWMGDNIYGDIRRPFKLFGKERTIGPWKNVPRFVPSSKEEMQSKYNLVKQNPHYSLLRHRAKVIGTWDDHDYGLNDAGKEFPDKVTNQRLMLDFLDEPEDSPRRKQAGVYASYTFGPAAKEIKVILLDTRYHRDPLRSDGTILGTSQWTWLEKELNGPSSALTIIVSSIQVISNLSATTGPLFYLESWGRFPKERKRLFNLIADSKRDGVVFISGDVHFGELTRYDCAGNGYPLYDITSSGLTQAVLKVVPSLLRPIVGFMAWFTPTTMRVIHNNCRYKSCTYGFFFLSLFIIYACVRMFFNNQFSKYDFSYNLLIRMFIFKSSVAPLGQPNFGVIEINWEAVPVSIRFEVRDEKGLAVIGDNTSLSELQARKVPGEQAGGKYKKHCSLEVTLPWILRHRLAILFFSSLAVLVIILIGLTYTGIVLSRRCICKCKVE